MSSARVSASSTVLVYSDDAAVRDRIRLAIGPRPAADVGRVRFVEAATDAEVIRVVDKGGVDVCVFDGEAWPAGGLGLARQLKNEIRDCPLIAVVLGRRDDRWLATWSQSDAVLAHPLDPVEAATTVADLLRRRAGHLPVST